MVSLSRFLQGEDNPHPHEFLGSRRDGDFVVLALSTLFAGYAAKVGP